MISSNTYIKWIRDLIDAELNLIAVGYNPDEKERIIHQKRFDMENPIKDIRLFSFIFSNIIEKYIGHKFKVRLIGTRVSFLPDFFPKKNPDVVLMRKYLDNISWKKKKYYGVFVIYNIYELFKVFTNYSLNYNYQDILLFSFEKDLVIQISHHGEIWLSSPSKDLLGIIGNELDKEGATVLYSYKK